MNKLCISRLLKTVIEYMKFMQYKNEDNMNIVIVSGKIISKVDFKFIYHKDKQMKHTSIANCKLQIGDRTKVDVYGYDEIADILYREHLETIWCEGTLEEGMKIKILTITSDYLN